ncbi:TetR/AcrR family transcriptional regulator [Kineobactrum salinum]|uniref:TetR/AcrR family transcriptional regulator n=1 Tax=Kineobactrum salinum TaxID=2708301 RepID=A0A6C0U1L6_9GAMM|nr:TetR/AcrR family transcriptional regulator [Kineobactrum salinum]QIB65439.1 TetR/AcrR family transcriptional regulator [Kineobactrum salinum]
MVRAKRSKPTFIEEARQKQIQEIARDLFIRVGFNQASLSDIAEAADISKGVILYHYGSKSELGKAVLEDILNTYGSFLSAQLEKKSTARDKLLELPNAFASYVQKNYESFLLYIDVLGSFGNLEEKKEYMSDTNQTQRAFLRRLIEDCKKEGCSFKLKSSALADVIQATLDGLIGQYSVDPDRVDLSACARVLRQFLNEAIKS